MNPIIKKLKTKQEKEFFQRCDEILHYIWDPIGCRDVPLARDEYWSYLPQIYKLLIKGADKVKITDYLTNIERTSMGMDTIDSHCRNVAELLIETREAIYE